MATTKIKICRCLNCKREYPFESFYDSKAEFLDVGNKIPYCKDCCKDIFTYYLKKIGNMQGALYYTCAKLDIPFIKKCYNAVEKMVKTYQGMSKNPKKESEYDIVAWYLDFLWFKSKMETPTDLWHCFADSDTEKNDVIGVKENEAIKLQLEEYKLNWGVQEIIEDYQFLSFIFEKYTKGLTFENAQQEDLYRDLCLARLEKRKIEEQRSNEDITKVQARILTLMKVLKVDDFSSSKPKSLSEQFLSNKIAMIDENNVQDIYNEPCEMKDFNKVQKYYRDICLRPLGNMLAGNKDFDLNLEDIQIYNMDNVVN